MADMARRLERSAGSRPQKDRRRLPGIRKRIRALLRRMPEGAGSSFPRPGDAMRGLVQAVLRARTDTQDGAPESMHRLRIAIKRYRYALEALVEAGTPGLPPAIDAARSLQSDLGSLHDLDVLIEVVRRDTHHPGAGAFLRRVLLRRSRQAEKTLRRLAGFRPVFASPAGGGYRARRAGVRVGPAPRAAQAGGTAA